jgi:hypothetical protein
MGSRLAEREEIGGPRHSRRILAALGIFAAGLGLPARALATDTVRLDIDLQAANGGDLPLFDRQLPSSTEFILEIALPGKDAARATLDVWPDGRGECGPPTSDKQHYTLAMALAGSDADRVLRATVPPLQVQTKFCFKVQIKRGLDEAQATIVASKTTTKLKGRADFVEACKPDGIKTLPKTVGDTVAEQLGELEGGNTAAGAYAQLAITRRVDPTSSQHAVDAVLAGLNFGDLCSKVNAASKEEVRGAALFDNAEAALASARRALLTTLPVEHPLKARLPLLVTGTGANVEIHRFDELPDEGPVLAAAVRALKEIDPKLADALQAVVDAESAKRPALKQSYLKAIRARRPGLAIFVVRKDGAPLEMPLDKLFVPANGTLIVPNLALLKQQLLAYVADDKVGANAWLAAFGRYETADQDARTLDADFRTKQQATRAAGEEIADAVKTRMQAPEVRALMTSSLAIHISQNTKAPPQTEAGASYVSPDIGVMVALPIYRTNDWAPWLVPYAGVNIYFAPVDRAVPFDQLVGNQALQRFSVTLGALLHRPDVNGTSISMAFTDSGVIPMLAGGWRMTSFTRISAGAFLFDYRDANPAIGDLRHGGAFWIGASIDADVWAVVKGKAFP